MVGSNHGAIQWQGLVEAIQCRTWVWSHTRTGNRHHQIGFILYLDGEAGEKEGLFGVAFSHLLYRRHVLHIGDLVRGTAWPCGEPKYDIADYHRAARIQVLARAPQRSVIKAPPFTGTMPRVDYYEDIQPRRLDPALWAGRCFPCKWANKAAVRPVVGSCAGKGCQAETFCYGPHSCSFYKGGMARPADHGHMQESGAAEG